MNEGLIIKGLMPKLETDRNILSDFLARHQLRYEEDIEYAVGLFEEDEIVACGCCAGSLLKGFAVEERFRGENILGSIISALVANRFSAGYYDIFIISPSQNSKLFVNCGFYPIARTKKLVFLEYRPDGIEGFFTKIGQREIQGGIVGAIVVNCNPFTLGHRYLIEYASARCDLLYIFVVQEEKSAFPFKVRLPLVEEGVADLPKVRVNTGGNYIISSATFPTYFLKQKDDGVKMQAELDAEVFASRIAPILSIKIRFVGSEPKCPVTRQYNKVLHKVLPKSGVEVIEVPRITTADGEAISASRVRALLAAGVMDSTLLQLVPETTYEYLISKSAAPIITALKKHRE